MSGDARAVIWPLVTPLKHPIRTSFGAMQNRPLLLLQLIDGEGYEGWGESWVNFPRWALDERVVVLRHLLADVLTGLPAPGAVGAVLARYRKQAVQSAGLGSFYHALSAIDGALWDLQARRRHRPLRDVLGEGGEQSPAIPVYASGIGPERVKDRIETAIAQGFTAVKIKVGFDQGVDHQNFQTARSLLGADAIIVDANQAWTREGALSEIAYYENYGAKWIEEPISALDFAGYHLLGQQSPSLAAGENWYLDQIAHSPSIRLKAVQPDLCKIGGVAAAEKFIASPALDAGYVAFHVLGGPVAQALSLQVASAWAARARWVECDTNENLVRDAIAPSWTLAGGTARLNRLPGLGLEIDPEALERFVAPHLRPFHQPLAWEAPD
ncbi:MAG: hypothetical protein M0Z53_07975 [Thermaerobacter sp.]|nr:hypothetical protein [Thermaerobacter sp.]